MQHQDSREQLLES